MPRVFIQSSWGTQLRLVFLLPAVLTALIFNRCLLFTLIWCSAHSSWVNSVLVYSHSILVYGMVVILSCCSYSTCVVIQCWRLSLSWYDFIIIGILSWCTGWNYSILVLSFCPDMIILCTHSILGLSCAQCELFYLKTIWFESVGWRIGVSKYRLLLTARMQQYMH